MYDIRWPIVMDSLSLVYPTAYMNDFTMSCCGNNVCKPIALSTLVVYCVYPLHLLSCQRTHPIWNVHIYWGWIFLELSSTYLNCLLNAGCFVKIFFGYYTLHSYNLNATPVRKLGCQNNAAKMQKKGKEKKKTHSGDLIPTHMLL